MRNHGVDESPEDSTPFEKLSSLPMPDARTPEQKAKDVDDVLNWMRNPKESNTPETSAFETGIGELVCNTGNGNSRCDEVVAC